MKETNHKWKSVLIPVDYPILIPPDQLYTDLVAHEFVQTLDHNHNNQYTSDGLCFARRRLIHYNLHRVSLNILDANLFALH